MKQKRLLSLLCLTFLLFGCGGGLSGSPVPVELRGQWQSIFSQVPGYYKGLVPTQDSLGTLGMFLYFTADGRYQLDLRVLLTYYNGNCFYNSHLEETGTLSIEGTAFTFRPAPAIQSVVDSCGKTSVKRIQGGPATLTVTLTQDQAGWPYLRLRFPNGEEAYLEKCRTCK